MSKPFAVINEIRKTVVIYEADGNTQFLPLTYRNRRLAGTNAAVIDERNHGLQEVHPPTLLPKAVGVPEYRKKPTVPAPVENGYKLHPCPGAEGGEPCGRMIRSKTVRCRDCWYQMTGKAK